MKTTARRYVAPRYPGITIARLIASGDVSGARSFRGHAPHAWRVCEARAIVGVDAQAILWPGVQS